MEGEPANATRVSQRGRGRGTHPVGDGEAILEDLVVPVALVEDVGADAASVSHGSYARAREMRMCVLDVGSSCSTFRGIKEPANRAVIVPLSMTAAGARMATGNQRDGRHSG